MDSWNSYPKIYNLGHPAVDDLLNEPVIVQEKVDGSQFSFGVFNGELHVRSKGRVFAPEAADNMFQAAVDAVRAVEPLLVDGWTYRGEYLRKPKHNALAYDRTPRNHIILFDINTGDQRYMPFLDVAAVAESLGFEVVPTLLDGMVEHVNQLTDLLNETSILGGQKIEGFVVKNYSRFGRDGKALFGKHVSESFREVHKGEWKKANPTQTGVIDGLAKDYRSEARWQKAVQHLAEAGDLTKSPKDIGALIKEVHRDIDDECREEICAALYKFAIKRINRESVKGLPQWYKEKLLEGQFE